MLGVVIQMPAQLVPSGSEIIGGRVLWQINNGALAITFNLPPQKAILTPNSETTTLVIQGQNISDGLKPLIEQSSN
jgi:hypothetical protein